MIKYLRIPFLVLALLSLLTGLGAGLGRMGWDLPGLAVIPHHGAIMVGGFLGTLIILEKIIPLKIKWLYLFPLMSAGSVAAYLFSLPALSGILLISASAGLTLAFLLYLLREKTAIYVIMAGGALCWLCGNIVLFTTYHYTQAVPWWIAFILLIITSERLELMKFLPVKNRHRRILYCLLAGVLAGCIHILPYHHIILGSSLIAISLWLLKFDLIRITLGKTGLTRYVAFALLSGYLSLFVSGTLLLLSGNSALYDSLVHSFFIGFAFSMIFAHGPIILPGVMGISVKPYHRILYAWLFLLNSSWIIRGIFLSAGLMEGRRYSGILTAIAILAYFASLAVLTARALRLKTGKATPARA